LLVTGLDADFNARRLERYLTAAWDSGADPVIVLTKLDVLDDDGKLVEAEAVAVGVPVHAVSNVTGEGLDELRALLRPAKTFVLLGSSGTGKSTLANRLAGRTVMDTGDLRNDGRGRHTTRHRQLLMMPGGAILIDTPGLRELQVWEGDLDSAFADIAELAAQCRFNDCAHSSEPDCAVTEALANGELDADRWQNYLKLQRSCGRSRRGAAAASSASSRAAGARVHASPGAPVVTGGSPRPSRENPRRVAETSAAWRPAFFGSPPPRCANPRCSPPEYGPSSPVSSLPPPFTIMSTTHRRPQPRRPRSRSNESRAIRGRSARRCC
jgi:ribosome small subunit-dependent GTPase A